MVGVIGTSIMADFIFFFLHSVLLCTKNALGFPLLFKITNKVIDTHIALVIYQSLITNGKDYDILGFLGGLDCKDH